MAEFWVYHGKAYSHARIHRASCPNCNDGTGQLGQDKKPDKERTASTWYPADSLEAARAIVDRLHPKDGGLCGTCLRSYR